jgi:hypothetical protein
VLDTDTHGGERLERELTVRERPTEGDVDEEHLVIPPDVAAL